VAQVLKESQAQMAQMVIQVLMDQTAAQVKKGLQAQMAQMVLQEVMVQMAVQVLKENQEVTVLQEVMD
jgi:hypothetical protein